MMEFYIYYRYILLFSSFSKHYQSFKLRPRSEFLEEQNFGMEAENRTSIGNNHNVYQKRRKK